MESATFYPGANRTVVPKHTEEHNRPGRIAIARKHPDAEAVQIMGYAGFVPLVPWIQAFIWAFKPTNIVDIRRFPAQEAKGIEEEIARLKGETEKPAPKPAEGTSPPAKPGSEK